MGDVVNDVVVVIVVVGDVVADVEPVEDTLDVTVVEREVVAVLETVVVPEVVGVDNMHSSNEPSR